MLRFRVVDDGEQVAAHSVHHGLNYRQGGVGRDGRIHCAAAPGQNGCSCLRGYSLQSGHDAVLRHDHGARLFTGRVLRRLNGGAANRPSRTMDTAFLMRSRIDFKGLSLFSGKGMTIIFPLSLFARMGKMRNLMIGTENAGRRSWQPPT